MSGKILTVDLRDFFFLSGNIVRADVAAGATGIIDVYQQFSGLAKSVLLDNRDAVNNATYRINSRAAVTTILRPGSSRVLTVPIELIEIVAGAGGGVEVTIEVIPLAVLQGKGKNALY